MDARMRTTRDGTDIQTTKSSTIATRGLFWLRSGGLSLRKRAGSDINKGLRDQRIKKLAISPACIVGMEFFSNSLR